MRVLIVKPHNMSNGRIASKSSKGMGMGSVLLNGSAGVASTITSDSPSVDGGFKTTTGAGLGSSINAKLEKLRLQSKKRPENIKFSI